MEIPRYSAVIFDIDGTVLNNELFIFDSFKQVYQLFEGRMITRQEIMGVLGKPLDICYRLTTASRNPNEEYIAQLCNRHRVYQEGIVDTVVPFPNTLATLEDLTKKGLLCAAVTSRGGYTMARNLELTGVGKFLAKVITPDIISHHKPHPEGVFKLIKELNLEPEDTLFVGDTDVDIITAKNAGITSVSALYGFHCDEPQRSALLSLRPDYVVDDISEVLPIVLIEK